MRANLDASGGLFFSQRVLTALVDRGIAREDAYAAVQRAAADVWDLGEHFRDRAMQEVEPLGIMSRDEFDALFDLEPYVANLDGVFEKLEKLPVEEGS
jgi:adenylosuccinate lyase